MVVLSSVVKKFLIDITQLDRTEETKRVTQPRGLRQSNDYLEQR
jgi:hypothetical protein